MKQGSERSVTRIYSDEVEFRRKGVRKRKECQSHTEVQLRDEVTGKDLSGVLAVRTEDTWEFALDKIGRAHV